MIYTSGRRAGTPLGWDAIQSNTNRVLWMMFRRKAIPMELLSKTIKAMMAEKIISNPQMKRVERAILTSCIYGPLRLVPDPHEGGYHIKGKRFDAIPGSDRHSDHLMNQIDHAVKVFQRIEYLHSQLSEHPVRKQEEPQGHGFQCSRATA